MESDFERPLEVAKVVEFDHDVSLKMHSVIFMLLAICIRTQKTILHMNIDRELLSFFWPRLSKQLLSNLGPVV